MSKCPKCEKMFTTVNIKPVTASAPFTLQWKAISYDCPYCHTSLSVQIDPIAIKNSIIEALKK